MFYSYNFFKETCEKYNEFSSFKEFYKSFSNEKEFGGDLSAHDHLVKRRFINNFNVVLNSFLRHSPSSVLDVGCGSGDNLMLSNMFSVEYHGLDYAEKTVEAARKSYPNVIFHVGDAFEMDFSDGQFDMVILSSVLILYSSKKDQIALLRECLRVLNSNGILILINWHDAFFVKYSIFFSRVLGKILGESIPMDFNGVHFSKKDIKNLASELNLSINEFVLTSSIQGVLESAKYLNFSKYRRSYSGGNKKIEYPQSILEDLVSEVGRFKFLTKFLYRIQQIFPSLFSFYSVAIIKKN